MSILGLSGQPRQLICSELTSKLSRKWLRAMTAPLRRLKTKPLKSFSYVQETMKYTILMYSVTC